MSLKDPTIKIVSNVYYMADKIIYRIISIDSIVNGLLLSLSFQSDINNL